MHTKHARKYIIFFSLTSSELIVVLAGAILLYCFISSEKQMRFTTVGVNLFLIISTYGLTFILNSLTVHWS